MPDLVLTRRQLNRATLARQLLLKRARITPVQAVERLTGLQAQLPRPPFVGLWTRLEGFRREDLAKAVERKQIVRATLMRATLHMVSARDFLALRGPIQPALTRSMQSILRDRLARIDLPRIVLETREFVAARPCTFEEIRAHLVSLHPGWDERAMGYAVRLNLPLVLVPSSGEWTWPGTSDFALAGAWLGKQLPASREDPRPVVLRYLAAFGPASITDAQAWSGLAGLREAFEGLRGQLRAFRDERKRELFDLPDAPRPPEDTPAPARFVPEYDNLLLAHDDRSRVVPREHHAKIFLSTARVAPTFLVDGHVAGTWKVELKKRVANLTVAAWEPIPRQARDELGLEGERLARFVEPTAEKVAVRFEKA